VAESGTTYLYGTGSLVGPGTINARWNGTGGLTFGPATRETQANLNAHTADIQSWLSGSGLQLSIRSPIANPAVCECSAGQLAALRVC
jgi:hypothetical protein